MNSLDGIRVLDLSRVLAGPWCTQTLADLGADVIKIERPGSGDDTRTWGPPFLKDDEGIETLEAAYYLGANRNKRSVTCDIAQPAGQALIRELVTHCDVFVENFKVGDMARYGLDYASLKALNPRLVYCSVTGFGQNGPYADRAGYDYAIQGMGGLMSVTGERDSLGDASAALAKRLKATTDMPVIMGFGVSTPAQAVEVAAPADGVVVASALMRILLDGGAPEDAGAFVAQLRKALDA